jgi:hypothetical protein
MNNLAKEFRICANDPQYSVIQKKRYLRAAKQLDAFSTVLRRFHAEFGPTIVAKLITHTISKCQSCNNQARSDEKFIHKSNCLWYFVEEMHSEEL